ncbi:major facilitator superfamily protein [Listeria grandensis FSL F6-0971]|uniref:Major facilitator superfamily protein n=1 Tax=Listeria grandensis FSL F6-0971 TaxID=1265819 RepID=W7BGX8_9LIST|nr:MFS transporter [Listeria grandensis]EUJ24060.1 major facilitator superfamily protein [Listeria grandensis FSL F6-0971]
MEQQMKPKRVVATKKKFRYWIGLLLGFGCLVNYFDRINLTVAGQVLMDELSITPAMFGILLSSFSWTYALMQIPMGLVLDRIGVKWLNRVCSIVWVFATGLTAFISGLLPLFILRLSLGVAEAPAFSAASKATGYWFPLKERGFATAMFDMSSKLSNVIGVPMVAFIIAKWGWREAFIVTAIISIVYCVWFWVLYRDPEEHPRLSKEELDYIQSGDAQKQVAPGEGSSLLYLVKQRKLWALAIGAAAYNYSFFLFLTWLPNYLMQELHLDIMKSGLYTAIPWACGALSSVLIGGLLVDFLIKRGFDPSKVRKLFLTIGMLLGLAVIGAATTKDTQTAIIFFSIAVSGICIASTINWSMPSILAPNGSVGTVGGFMNFIGNLTAIAAPIVTGFIVGATGSFSIAFVVAGVVMLIGILSITIFLGRIEKIPDEEKKAILD